MRKEIIIGTGITGGVLIVAGLILRTVNTKKYAPKPISENCITITEIGEEYADRICDDLKEKEAMFREKEFKRYSR